MKIINIINEEITNLFETSFFDYNNDSILNEKYLDYLIKNNSIFNDDYLFYYKDTFKLEDDDDTVLKTEGFRNYIKEILEQNLEKFKEDLYDNVDEYDKIKIYRAITVNDDWINHLKTQGKRLGIYWSWSPDGAETHWGDYSKNNTAIITAIIDEKYVNWTDTFRLNIDPILMDEKEIRLFKNTPLNILSITVNGNEIDLSELKNKIFYS